MSRDILNYSFLLGGELVERDGRKLKIFYGMSSSTAMRKHAGGVAEYRYIFCFNDFCASLYDLLTLTYSASLML